MMKRRDFMKHVTSSAVYLSTMSISSGLNARLSFRESNEKNEIERHILSLIDLSKYESVARWIKTKMTAYLYEGPLFQYTIESVGNIESTIDPTTKYSHQCAIEYLNEMAGVRNYNQFIPCLSTSAVILKGKLVSRYLSRVKLIEGDCEGLEEFLVFEDGYQIVELTSKKALRHEAIVLGHSPDDFLTAFHYPKHYSDYKVFSLRDPQNCPRVTIEIYPKNRINVMEGRYKLPFPAKYAAYVREFVRKGYSFDRIYCEDLKLAPLT